MVALQILLEWCDDDRQIPRKLKRPIADTAWKKLAELAEVSKRGVTVEDAAKYKFIAEDLIDKFNVCLGKNNAGGFEDENQLTHTNVDVYDGLWGTWQDMPLETKHFACGLA